MNQTTMELNEQELASTTLSYINDEDRKSIYLDSILVTPDGKIYIVEIFSFENKPNILITVNLVKPKQRDLEGLLAVRADSPIEVIKVFQPMVMKPCKNFVVSRSKHYEPGICVTGYLDNNKPKYSLDYNENSTFPRKKIEEQNSDIIKSYLNDNDINLLVYSNKIFIGSDLYYLIEILSYVAKPKLLVKVSLNKKGISDSPLKPGWISVSSSNSASESMYFEPTLITPCNSYKTYISDIDNRTLCLEGYSKNSQLVLKLDYNEESENPVWRTCLDNPVQSPKGTQEMKDIGIFSSSIAPGNGLTYPTTVINKEVPKEAFIKTHRTKEGLTKDGPVQNNVKKDEVTQQSIKRISVSTNFTNNGVYNLLVETYIDSTCKIRLSKYSGFAVKEDLIWNSEIITVESDMYSLELPLDGGVKVYGRGIDHNECKIFYWNEKGILLSMMTVNK